MSLLTEASLVITPNAVEEGKLFSIIPTDGSGDMTAVRATTATLVNSERLIENVAINVPRLDYTNGSCPSILVEPQRTNLLLRSEEFSNIIWVKTNTTVTEDSTISPDGTTNADTFTLVSSTSRVVQSLTLGAGSYTVSVYLKITSGTPNLRFQINIDGTSTDFSITGLSSVWQRYTATFTAITSVANFAIRGLGGVGEVAVWGVQIEAGSNATSYIPTVASAVTRNADVISKTGISSLINGEEGVLFCEISALANDRTDRLISLTNGTSTERISIYYSSSTSNEIKAIIFVGAVIQCNFSYTGSDITDMAKIALKYKQNDFSLFVNGIKRATDNSGITFPANKLNKLSFDLGLPTITLPFFGNVKQVQLYKTALTDEQCIALTTL